MLLDALLTRLRSCSHSRPPLGLVTLARTSLEGKPVYFLLRSDGPTHPSELLDAGVDALALVDAWRILVVDRFLDLTTEEATRLAKAALEAPCPASL